MDSFAAALDNLEYLDKLDNCKEYQDFADIILQQRTTLEKFAIELISQCRFEEAEEVLKQL